MSSFLFIIFWGAMLVATPHSQGEPQVTAVEEKKRELDTIQHQLQKSQLQLQHHSNQEQSVLDRLDTISRRQAKLAQEVYTTEQELQTAEKQADTLQTTYDNVSLQLGRQQQRLRQRVRQLYKLGQLPYVKMLLSAKDVAEFSRKVQYIQHLANRDREQIEAYHRRRRQLTQAQFELEMTTQRIGMTQARLSAKRSALVREHQRQETFLQSVREKKALTEKAVVEFALAARTLTHLVERLQEQARRAPSPQVAVKGQLFWPLDGTILSSYGRIRHPTLDVVTFQKGMYISAPFGQEVRAAADGKVVYADWFQGLGRLLLVDHGHHIVTLYGHTSEILVRVGDVVYSQQVVARVGDSSTFEEPALYFAVRHKTAPQDPLHWLRQRSVRLIERPDDGAGEFK